MSLKLPLDALQTLGTLEAADSGDSCVLTVPVYYKDGALKRMQRIHLAVDESSGPAPMIRLETTIMEREVALQKLVTALRRSDAERIRKSEDGEPPKPVAPRKTSPGRDLLYLLQHNDRLRGVSLHLAPTGEGGRLIARSDLVCLAGTIDPQLLLSRIHRLARVADGMELRATGDDIW